MTPQPRRAGRAWLAPAALTLALCSCASPVKDAAAPSAGAAAAAEGGAAPAQASSAATRWVRVQAEQHSRGLAVPARVVVDAASRAEVRPLADGVLLRVLVRAGDRVRRGALVATLRAPVVAAARAQLVGVARQLAPAKRRLSELSRLRKEGLGQRGPEASLAREVAGLEAARHRARAAVAAARDPHCDARARAEAADDLPICAPADGVVGALGARVGAAAGPDHAALAVLWRQAPARVAVRHPRPPPQGVTLTFVGEDGSRAALESDPTSRVVDPADGARVAFHRTRGDLPLPAGLRGEARLHLAPGALRVPASAVVRRGNAVMVLRRAGTGVTRVVVDLIGRAGADALVRNPASRGAASGAAAPQGAPLRVGDEVAADAALLDDDLLDDGLPEGASIDGAAPEGAGTEAPQGARGGS